MLAVKNNEEVKILDMQKKEYLEAGYTIFDDKLEVVAKPKDKAEVEISKLEEKIKGLEKENAELKEKIKGLEKEPVSKDLTVDEIKEKLTSLGIEFNKGAKKADLLKLLPQE